MGSLFLERRIMTVKEIYESALSLMGQRQENDFYTFAPTWVSLALAKATPFENAIRRGEKREEIITPPHLTKLTDEIDFSPTLRWPLVYGVAFYIALAVESDMREEYRKEFFYLLESLTPTLISPIKDIYAGGE